MVEFFRKNDLTADTSINAAFKDVYDGVQTTAIIKGGRAKRNYLFTAEIPNKPTYGDAVFKGCDFHLYCTGVTPGKTVDFPELVAYKLQEPQAISEGFQQIDSTYGTKLHVVSGAVNGFNSIIDYFDGNTDSGADKAFFTNNGRRSVINKLAYTTVYDLYHYGVSIELGPNIKAKNLTAFTSYNKIRQVYGRSASETGIRGLSNTPQSLASGKGGGLNSKDYVLLVKSTKEEDKNNGHGFFKAVKVDNSITDKMLHISADPNSGLTKFGLVEESSPNEEGYGNEATPSNTIFELVKNSAEFTYNESGGTSTGATIGVGIARMNEKNFLTRSSSLEMYCLWDHDEKNQIEYPSLRDDGPANRQEVMLLKRNIPYPLNFPIKPDTDTDTSSVNYDAATYGGTLEIDINLQQLAFAFTHSDDESGGLDFQQDTTGNSSLDSDVDEKLHTLRRAFTIMFAKEPPSVNDTLFDYVTDLTTATSEWDKTNHGKYRLANLNRSGSGSSGDSDEGSVYNIRDNDGMTPFTGVTFIKTKKGISVIPVNGTRGESLGGHALDTNSWYITKKGSQAESCTDDIIILDSSLGNNKQDSMNIENRWIRLSFVFTPSQSQSVGSGDTSDADSAKSHYSFCRLYITDIKDGTILPNAAASTWSANTRHYDLGLIGDDGGFLSYYAGTVDLSGSTTAVGEGVSSGASDTDHDNMGNWPKHMSMWLTNYPEEQSSNDETDFEIPSNSYTPESKVLIDRIAWKDFNYSHYNASLGEDNIDIRSPIHIGMGKASLGPNESSDVSSSFENNWTSRVTDTPSFLLFGINPISDSDQIFGKGNVDAGERNYSSYNWPHAFYLSDFDCTNLNNLGTIDDKYIRGGISGMMHSTSDNDLISLGDSFGDYLLDDSSINPSHVYPNQSTSGGKAGAVLSHTYSTLSVASVNTGTKTITTSANTNFSSSSPMPFQKGDDLRFAHAGVIDDASIGEITSLSGDLHSSGLTIVTSDTPSSNINTDSDIQVAEKGLCQNFSRKGAFQIWKNSGGGTNPIKKEHVACSSRVLEIQEKTSKQVTLKVDTVTPLIHDEDEKYIVYLYNHSIDGSGSATTGNRDFELSNPTGYSDAAAGARFEAHDLVATEIDRINNTITLSWDGTSTNTSNSYEIATYDNIPYMLISPYRQWGYWVINTRDSDGNILAPRSYGSMVLLDNNFTDKDGAIRVFNGKKNDTAANIAGDIIQRANASAGTANFGFGTTFNEYLYNDDTVSTIPGAYINRWDLTPHEDNPTLDLSEDLGFGAYTDDAPNNTGFIAKTLIKNDRFNIFKARDITKAVKPGEDLSVYFTYKDPTIDHETSIYTSKRTAETDKPKIVSIFEDEIPKNPILTVGPNADDPFFPEFKWTTSDPDLWYGLLQISNEPQISNQYDGAVAHIPLNEDTTSYTGVYLENESGTKTAATAGQFVNRLDGLAGYSKEFDGTDDYLTFADFTAPSDEMTIIAHIIPDSGSSGTRTILSKWNNGSDTLNDYELELNPNHQVKFNCLANGGSVMTSVYGPSIPVDGETPTAIMATVETNAARNNLKLYYNGKLVAQSAAASAGASTSTAWEGGGSISGTGADVEDDSGVLYVGANANASATRADFFDGRIEEIAIYNRVLYPVVPASGSYILDRPLYEVDGNFTSPVQYTARLFMKDYHNIRGKTTEEVAASSQISYQKAAFRLNT